MSVLHKVLSGLSLGYSIAVLGKSTEEKGEGDGCWSYRKRVVQWQGQKAGTMRAQQGVLGSRARMPCLAYFVRNSTPSSVLTVLARDFPWTFTFSMLYIDNPVSTTGYHRAPVLASCMFVFTMYSHGCMLIGQQQAALTMMSV